VKFSPTPYAQSIIPEWLGWIEASSIACIVQPIVTVKRHIENGFVVVADLHRDVDVRVVAVVYSTEKVISVEIARMRSKLKVVV